MIATTLATLILTSNPLQTHRDKVTHFGVAFAGTTVLDFACNEMFDNAKQECLLASNAAMLAAGILWEIEGNRDINDLGANVLGQAGASLIIGFKW